MFPRGFDAKRRLPVPQLNEQVSLSGNGIFPQVHFLQIFFVVGEVHVLKGQGKTNGIVKFHIITVHLLIIFTDSHRASADFVYHQAVFPPGGRKKIPDYPKEQCQ